MEFILKILIISLNLFNQIGDTDVKYKYSMLYISFNYIKHGIY